MVKAVIFDDDLEFCRILKPKLQKIAEKQGILMESRIAADKSWLMDAEQKYDVCFMDIAMPGMSGIDAAKSLRERCPETEVIFVSAYEQYMRESIYAKPLAFVRKANLEEDLEEAVRVFGEVWKHKNRTALVSNNTKQTAVTPARVIYCQSVDHYIRIYEIHDGRKMIRSSLNKLEDELSGYSFMRVHARFLVNMDYIRGADTNKVIMQDGSAIPVSYKYRQQVKEKLFDMMRRRTGPDLIG